MDLLYKIKKIWMQEGTVELFKKISNRIWIGSLSWLQRKMIKISHSHKISKYMINIFDKFLYQYPTVDEQVKKYNYKKENRSEVFFAAVEGGMNSHMFRNSVLAHGFSTRGYKPYFLLCDSELDLCHAKESNDDKVTCEICLNRGICLTERFGIEPNFFSEVLEDDYEPSGFDIQCESYNNVNIKEYVNGSFRRFNKKYSINLSDEKKKEIYERLYKSAVTCVDVADKLFRERDFVATVTSHPAYIYGGVFMEVSKKHGVPAYAHSSTTQNKAISFGTSNNQLPLYKFADNESVSKRLQTPLNKNENRWVKKYFNQLKTGEGRNRDYAQFGTSGLNNSSDVTLGLFPNLAWDAKLDSRNHLFNDPFEWISHIFEYIHNKANVSLIIKTHPAESIIGTNESFYQWIQNEFDLTNYPSITLLPPDTEVDQYQMIEQIDAGIVIDSTIGLEMSYIGTPTIVTGNAHYRGKGFTFDPETVNEYECLLDHADELVVTDQMIEYCKRLTYHVFNENVIKFEYDNDSSGVCHEKIVNDKNMDLIVKNISNGNPVSYFDN